MADWQRKCVSGPRLRMRQENLLQRLLQRSADMYIINNLYPLLSLHRKVLAQSLIDSFTDFVLM